MQLDRLWRQAFGEPLPILGAAAFVRPILAKANDQPRKIGLAVRQGSTEKSLVSRR